MKLKYFLASSPKVAEPALLTICTIAIPYMIIYAVDSSQTPSTGSLGRTCTSSSRELSSTLFVVFLKDPSVCANAHGTEESSYLKTSLKFISLDLDTMRSRANKFLSTLTVTSFSSVDFTLAFFDRTANVFIFILGIGSQNPTSLVCIRLFTNDFISCAPRLSALRRLCDNSSGITTPVARFDNGSSSVASTLNGFDIAVFNVQITLPTSSLSLFTLTLPDSLCASPVV